MRALDWRRVFSSAVLAPVVLATAGCLAVAWVGLEAVYAPAFLPDRQVVRDLAYAGDARRERLDLYCPEGRGWPVLVFAYGGGWRAGSKDLRIAGADVYGNLGRFFAARGLGVAVVDYRLQPEVTWRDQVADVAAASAWVRAHIASYGGNPRALFLAGHSAGGQLVTFVTLNRDVRARWGLAGDAIRGTIVVSGAGLDLTDERQYELGASRRYFAERFGDGTGDRWKREASALAYARPGAPPFLLVVAGQDPAWIQWQMHLLYSALRGAGGEASVQSVEQENHFSLVLALSREGATTRALLGFVSQQAR